MPMRDDPFLPGPAIHLAGRAGGALSGLSFAAKDLFDVAGHPTGGGNPDWAAHHPTPTRHAWAVQALLDAGADLVGKTVTDEVSLGISEPARQSQTWVRFPDAGQGGGWKVVLAQVSVTEASPAY